MIKDLQHAIENESDLSRIAKYKDDIAIFRQQISEYDADIKKLTPFARYSRLPERSK